MLKRSHTRAFFSWGKPIIETVEDMKKMFVNDIGGVIVIDVSRCRLNHCKQIVLRHVIRLQAKSYDKADTKSVQVKISDTEQRNFRLANDAKGHELKSGILSDPLLTCFEKI